MNFNLIKRTVRSITPRATLELIHDEGREYYYIYISTITKEELKQIEHHTDSEIENISVSYNHNRKLQITMKRNNPQRNQSHEHC